MPRSKMCTPVGKSYEDRFGDRPMTTICRGKRIGIEDIRRDQIIVADATPLQLGIALVRTNALFRHCGLFSQNDLLYCGDCLGMGALEGKEAGSDRTT
jgi:hypothetical protein